MRFHNLRAFSLIFEIFSCYFVCVEERISEERKEGKEKNSREKKSFESGNGVEWESIWVWESKLDLSLKSYVFGDF